MSGPYTVLGTYACGKFLSVLRLLLSWNEIWVAKSMFQLFLFFWNIGRAQSFQN